MVSVHYFGKKLITKCSENENKQKDQNHNVLDARNNVD